jgi:hypothetical protein
MYCKDDVIELIVVPKVVYNNPKKVNDVVICLLSVKRDSNFTLCLSNRFNDRSVIFREFVYNLFAYYSIRLRYQLLYIRILKA